MATVREFISTVRHTLNSLTLDNYISSEYIYNVGLSISKLLAKRESDSRRIFKSTFNFNYIDCIELEEINAAQCTGAPKCKKLMRSKKPIPETFVSNYGSIMFVFNVDKSKDYIEVNPISYKSIAAQEFKPKGKGYFWLENKYLIIPDSEVEIVSILGLFTDPISLDQNAASSCGKVLDMPFPALDYLLSSITELTTRTIISSKQIPVDENSNLNVNEK
jgi:hypothetical protein